MNCVPADREVERPAPLPLTTDRLAGQACWPAPPAGVPPLLRRTGGRTLLLGLGALLLPACIPTYPTAQSSLGPTRQAAVAEATYATPRPTPRPQTSASAAKQAQAPLTAQPANPDDPNLAQASLTAPPDKPVEEKIEVSNDTRIREILEQADLLREGVFNNAEREIYTSSVPSKEPGGEAQIRYLAVLNYHGSRPQLREARSLYEKVLVMDPGNPNALLGLGNLALMEVLNLVADRSELEYRIATDQTLLESLDQMRRRIGLLERSITTNLLAAQLKFKTVLGMNPNDATAHLGIAIALALGQQWTKAAEKCSQIYEAKQFTFQDRSVFYVWWGFVNEQLGDRARAIALYSTAAEIDEPHSWSEWANARVQELELQK